MTRVPEYRFQSNFGDGDCGAGEIYTRVREMTAKHWDNSNDGLFEI